MPPPPYRLRGRRCRLPRCALPAFCDSHDPVHLALRLPFPLLVSGHHHGACAHRKAKHAGGGCFQHIHRRPSSSPSCVRSRVHEHSSTQSYPARFDLVHCKQCMPKRLGLLFLFTSVIGRMFFCSLAFGFDVLEALSILFPLFSLYAIHWQLCRHGTPLPVRRMIERQQASSAVKHKGGIPLCKRPIPTKDASGQPLSRWPWRSP